MDGTALDSFSLLSYYHNTISDCDEASFPRFRRERGFDPLFDSAWKWSGWKQWKVCFRIVSKSDTIGQKRAGKCYLEFRTTSTDQKAGSSNLSGRTKTREKPCVSCGFCLVFGTFCSCAFFVTMVLTHTGNLSEQHRITRFPWYLRRFSGLRWSHGHKCRG